jgi:hypothetical protein
MLMGRCNAVEKYLKDFVLLYFMTSQTPMTKVSQHVIVMTLI